MQIQTNLLIAELLNLAEDATDAAKQFKTLSTTELNFKKSLEAWSILECLEHLNLYGDFYLPEIEKQILANTKHRANSVFKTGLLGNYFAGLMKAKNGNIKKLKAPKDKNPVNSALTITTVHRFIKQLELLKVLLEQARTVDLTKTKTAISLTPLIKLRLGDTFRFYVYHIERHIAQAERAAKAAEAHSYAKEGSKTVLL
ncbi:DinB family protein [Ferruginibacter sp.]